MGEKSIFPLQSNKYLSTGNGDCRRDFHREWKFKVFVEICPHSIFHFPQRMGKSYQVSVISGQGWYFSYLRDEK